MKAIVLFALVALSFSSKIINKEFVNSLKKIAPFEVYAPEENPFRDYTDEELKGLMGDFEAQNEEPFDGLAQKLRDVPESWDFRVDYADCALTIKDQMSCGSCWAFAASTALQHRFCFASQKEIKVMLSAQHLVSCDTASHACQGGYRDTSWKFFQEKGIVDEDCFPYTAGEGDVEPCITECKNGQPWKVYKVTDYAGYKNPAAIKEEMVAHGPIHTGFQVYSDFMSYKSGIYEHKSGSYMGGHAVVFVGYGVEDGVDYWICQNSWGPAWGESGFFRIKVGECSIDINSWVSKLIFFTFINYFFNLLYFIGWNTTHLSLRVSLLDNFISTSFPLQALNLFYKSNKVNFTLFILFFAFFFYILFFYFY